MLRALLGCTLMLWWTCGSRAQDLVDVFAADLETVEFRGTNYDLPLPTGTTVVTRMEMAPLTGSSRLDLCVLTDLNGGELWVYHSVGYSVADEPVVLSETTPVVDFTTLETDSGGSVLVVSTALDCWIYDGSGGSFDETSNFGSAWANVTQLQQADWADSDTPGLAAVAADGRTILRMRDVSGGQETFTVYTTEDPVQQLHTLQWDPASPEFEVAVLTCDEFEGTALLEFRDAQGNILPSAQSPSGLHSYPADGTYNHVTVIPGYDPASGADGVHWLTYLGTDVYALVASDQVYEPPMPFGQTPLADAVCVPWGPDGHHDMLFSTGEMNVAFVLMGEDPDQPLSPHRFNVQWLPDAWIVHEYRGSASFRSGKSVSDGATVTTGDVDGDGDQDAVFFRGYEQTPDLWMARSRKADEGAFLADAASITIGYDDPVVLQLTLNTPAVGPDVYAQFEVRAQRNVTE